jgi:hypothetical protein
MGPLHHVQLAMAGVELRGLEVSGAGPRRPEAGSTYAGLVLITQVRGRSWGLWYPMRRPWQCTLQPVQIISPGPC